MKSIVLEILNENCSAKIFFAFRLWLLQKNSYKKSCYCHLSGQQYSLTHNEQWIFKKLLFLELSVVSIESLVEEFSGEPELQSESRISHLAHSYYWFFPMFCFGKISSWFESIAFVLQGKANNKIKPIRLHDSWQNNYPVLVIIAYLLNKSAGKQSQIQQDFSSSSVSSKILLYVSWNVL